MMWLAARRMPDPRAIMCCTSTLRWLIVLTLPPRYRCPLNRLPASRLLLPRSGQERSDFVPWPIASFCGNAAVQSVSDRSTHLATLRVTTRQIKRPVRRNANERAGKP
jgi:hypothetical protein